VNKLKTEEAIRVMQAYADGAEIEHQIFGQDAWCGDKPSWNWSACTYRIKTKPLECWVVLTIKGEQFGLAKNEADALKDAKAIHGRIVRMVQADG